MINVNFYGVDGIKNRERNAVLLYLKQTLKSDGVYKNFQFSVDNPEAEWQMVGSWELPLYCANIGTFSPQQKFIFQQQEPPEMSWPDPQLLKRFCAIMTPFRMAVEGPEQFIGPPVLGWSYGVHVEMREGVGHWFSKEKMLNLADVVALGFPQKSRLCSMIVSHKSFLPGHRTRVQFFRTLEQHFAKKIDFFGFGFNPVNDKRDAIDPYLFSIAVENSVHDYYWTEKIADVYLGYTMPIYHGSPNIDHYFSSESMHLINIDNIDYSIAKIEDVLGHPEKFDAKLIAQERVKVLRDYNFVAWTAAVIEAIIRDRQCT